MRRNDSSFDIYPAHILFFSFSFASDYGTEIAKSLMGNIDLTLLHGIHIRPGHGPKTPHWPVHPPGSFSTVILRHSSCLLLQSSYLKPAERENIGCKRMRLGAEEIESF
jgi:hypothetical protein